MFKKPLTLTSLLVVIPLYANASEFSLESHTGTENTHAVEISDLATTMPATSSDVISHENALEKIGNEVVDAVSDTRSKAVILAKYAKDPLINVFDLSVDVKDNIAKI